MKTFEHALREVACQLTEIDYLVVTSRAMLIRGTRWRIEFPPEVELHRYGIGREGEVILQPPRLP